jgi:hypothetical protein
MTKTISLEISTTEANLLFEYGMYRSSLKEASPTEVNLWKKIMWEIKDKFLATSKTYSIHKVRLKPEDYSH